VVVLDDIHRADAGSLALLRHVAAELPTLPVLVLATYRDTDLGANVLLRDLLEAVLDAPGCDYLDLLPLTVEAAIECATLAVGRRIDPERLIAVIARSGGNPFFVEELVRATAAGVEASLPRSVGPVVRGRLAGLGADGRRVLEALAVLGGEADESLLAGVLSTTTGDLVARLGPAVEVRLVEVRCQRVRFPHALVCEVVLADLAPAAGATLHRRAVDVLQHPAGPLPDKGTGTETGTDTDSDTDSDTDAGARAEALAHHALAAESGGGDVDAATYVLEAGAWCERRFAFESAADLYARGLAGPSGAARRIALLLARGEALVRGGFPVDARSCFEDAAREAAGDGEVLGRAGLGLAASVVTADEG
jgi:hypothetical protein